MRYGVFAEYADYPTDMRNTNGSIDLWLNRSSDYPADMRKLNIYNGLRRTPTLATEAIGVRAPHSSSQYRNSPHRAPWLGWESVDQHVMPASRAGLEIVQIDVEERVNLHAIRADVDQPDVKSSRVVERAQERVGDVHPLAVAGHVHHVGLNARGDRALELEDARDQ